MSVVLGLYLVVLSSSIRHQRIVFVTVPMHGSSPDGLGQTSLHTYRLIRMFNLINAYFVLQ